MIVAINAIVKYSIVNPYLLLLSFSRKNVSAFDLELFFIGFFFETTCMSTSNYDPNIWPLGCPWVYPREARSKKILKVMFIGAHPDDPGLLASGLSIKLSQRGHKMKFVSMTNGNMGHQTKQPIELAYIELLETMKAAAGVGAEYECLNINDGYVWNNYENLEKVVSVIRRFDPDCVITHRPNDYHRDHRHTSQIVLDASYMLIVPHYYPDTPIPESRKMPVFMYSYDKFQKPYPFIPHVLLDITDVYQQKAAALINHESQMMEWLPWTMNQEDLVPPDYDVKLRYEILEMLLISVYARVLSDFRPLWKKGFPGKRVAQAEAFEICEYGTQPSKELLAELFPGCYIPSEEELEQVASPNLYKRLDKMEKRLKQLEEKLTGKEGQ
jgi:LmbE family N-acetylglucosaminyl deacetylase